MPLSKSPRIHASAHRPVGTAEAIWAQWLFWELAAAYDNEKEAIRLYRLSFFGTMAREMSKRMHLARGIAPRFQNTLYEHLYILGTMMLERMGGPLELVQAPDAAGTSRWLEHMQSDFVCIHRITKNLLRLEKYDPDIASINKSIHLTKEIPTPNETKPGESSLNFMWRRWRYSPHIIFAIVECRITCDMLVDSFNDPKKLDTTNIYRAVSIAHNCRNHLANLKPKGLKRSAVVVDTAKLASPETSELWRYNGCRQPILQHTDETVFEFPFFNDNEIYILGHYRS